METLPHLTGEPRYRALFLGAGPQMQCGVGQFTRLLQETIEKLEPGTSATLTLTPSEGSLAEIWRAVGAARSVVCNFPIVAWERVLFAPLMAMTIARLRRRKVVLIQHQWNRLHWLRRIACMPALLLADSIIMFSPLEQRELARDRLVGWTAKKSVLAPLPPNIEAPVGIADSRLKHRLSAAKGDGRLLIGHFGSVYPGKQPHALLDIGAILKQRGLRPLLVYIGPFIRGVDKIEEEFRARARELDLENDVIVSGFVASNHEVFGLFSEIDAFCDPLDAGITAGRSSLLTCVQSGHPLIVAGPVLEEEFDHHPRFKALIARGAVVLVARGAGNEAYADRIAAVVKRPHGPFPFDFDGWWTDVAEAVRAHL